MKPPTRRALAARSLNPADGVFVPCRGKFCVVSDSESALVPDRRHAPPASARIAVADCTGRWGYTTERGACIFPVQYERTLETLATYAGIRLHHKRLFLDRRGRAYPLLSVTSRLQDEAHLYLTAHREAAAWVLRTCDGVMVTRFHDVQAYFHEQRALLKTSQGWCYFDTSGKRVWAPPSGQAGHYRNGRARFLKRRKWGYADLAGTVLIEPQFDSAWNYSEGLASVEWNGRWLYINEAGEVAVDAGFSDARDFADGFARASADVMFAIRAAPSGRRLEVQGSYGFIDRTGNFTIPPLYRSAQDFSEGLAAVKLSMRWGYIDKGGLVAIPATYSWVSPFSQGLACVKRNGRYGYVARTGDVAIELRYLKAFDFSEGLAAVRQNGAWGFIDTAGSWAINPTFEDVSPFREGLARAGVSGRFGYIHRSGKWAIPPRYEGATSFSEGLALVQQGKRRACIDAGGETVFVVS